MQQAKARQVGLASWQKGKASVKGNFSAQVALA